VVIPVSADRLWHALLLCDGYDAGKLEGCVDERLILSLYWYAIMQPRYENRVRFTGPATDAVGLPQPTFEYSLGPEDHARHQAALDDLRAAGRQLGTFLPTSPPRKLSAGSSMHVMGTTRIGRSDDGHSVADPYGRVWGCTNLYIGGTGLIPSATATNPTLAACAIAVRTADRIIEARRTTM
jgi:pyranose oxidase